MPAMQLPFSALDALIDPLPHPLLFATVSGANRYRFPPPDSGRKLRGSRLSPRPASWSQGEPRETPGELPVARVYRAGADARPLVAARGSVLEGKRC